MIKQNTPAKFKQKVKKSIKSRLSSVCPHWQITHFSWTFKTIINNLTPPLLVIWTFIMVFICHVAYDLSFRIFTILSVKILSILPLVNSGKKLNLTGFAIMILVVEVGGALLLPLGWAPGTGDGRCGNITLKSCY